jgi:hypothetical protein
MIMLLGLYYISEEKQRVWQQQIMQYDRLVLPISIKCRIVKRRNFMTVGPLEYVMVAFEGNRFSGQILTALRDAQEKGIIRVIDMLMIKKDEQGNVMALELSELSEEEARPFGFLAGGLLNIFGPDDVEATVEQMPNNSAAGLLLIEDTWAIPLKEAILNAGAVASTGGLVAREVVQSIEAEIEAEAAAKQQAAVKATE